MAKILIVDDEELLRSLASETLTRQGHKCLTACSGPEGLEKLMSEDPDLILSDFKMPRMTGLEFLKEVQVRKPGQPFIIMTAYGTIETAVEAMQMGASDFLEKPYQPEILEHSVSRVLANLDVLRENRTLREQLLEKHSFVGDSEVHRELDRVVGEVAESGATILITGESGVGKEVLARNIHARSNRIGRAFVKINCAALPESLIESELFGHEKGAFTGAIRTKRGKFEMADKGSLLLDEVGEMPLMAQVKLLRVLQEREISRVGGDEEISLDVRVICTTNRDLAKEVEEGRFREDLFYRLNVIPVHLAPLRERPDDVESLVEHFIIRINNEYGYSVEGLEADALQHLRSYSWPGNIRQLENAVERAMVFTKTGLLPIESFDLLFGPGSLKSSAATSSLKSGMTVAEAEQILIIKTLRDCAGNKTKASDLLDISIRTLRNKLHEYGEFETFREKSEAVD